MKFTLISDHTIQASPLGHSNLLVTVNGLEISLPSKLSQIRVNAGTLNGIIWDMTLLVFLPCYSQSQYLVTNTTLIIKDNLVYG